jgi:TAG lipase/lysophosphatidylethanolamine acyltransferase
MVYLLRGGLLRNFGGISDRKLFTHSYLGTKQMIEDYMDEVVTQIEYVESSPDLDPQIKMKFFSDTRQGFGRSALVLQGASAFGKRHIKMETLHLLNPFFCCQSSVSYWCRQGVE